VRVIENVEAFDWIALDQGEVTLDVRADSVDRAAGIYRARLGSATGTIMTASFVFGPSEPRCAPLAPLSEYRESIWNDEGLYQSGMFHGPLFQSIRHIDGWDEQGIDAQLSTLGLHGFFAPNEEPALVLNPVMLDAMGQLAAFWIAQSVGTDFNCFPSTIERIELYADCPQNLEAVRLRARQRPLDAAPSDATGPLAWSFEILDGADQPLVRVEKLVNVFFPVPHRFYELRRDPLYGWLGEAAELPGRPDIMLWELPLLSDEFCSRSAGIFMRIVAHVVLDRAEREEWHALTGSVRHRREWLLGRVCIKEATRYWIYQRTGELLYPTDIVVLHDQHGAPFVDGWWRDAVHEAPAVSLSHDEHACLAAVADPATPVGVDREELGRVQRPDLMAEALTANERELLVGLEGVELQERILRIWCAKEAAAKYLGRGLGGVPTAFEVTFADQALEIGHVAHGDVPVQVDIVRQDSSIIALASATNWEM